MHVRAAVRHEKLNAGATLIALQPRVHVRTREKEGLGTRLHTSLIKVGLHSAISQGEENETDTHEQQSNTVKQ